MNILFKEVFKVSRFFALDLDVLFVLDISLIWANCMV